jgi:hypothetical protein
VELLDVAATLLQSVPRDFYCAPCLGAALPASTSGASEISTALAHRPSFEQRDTACVACGRHAMAVAFVPTKCVRCSRIVDDSELVVEHGERFHDHCWQIMRSNSRIADSRQMARLSQELILRSVDRMLRSSDDSR